MKRLLLTENELDQWRWNIIVWGHEVKSRNLCRRL